MNPQSSQPSTDFPGGPSPSTTGVVPVIQNTAQPQKYKNMAVATVLGIFLGWLGLHDFYIGRKILGWMHIGVTGIGIALCMHNPASLFLTYDDFPEGLGRRILMGSIIWGLVEVIIINCRKNNPKKIGFTTETPKETTNLLQIYHKHIQHNKVCAILTIIVAFILPIIYGIACIICVTISQQSVATATHSYEATPIPLLMLEIFFVAFIFCWFIPFTMVPLAVTILLLKIDFRWIVIANIIIAIILSCCNIIFVIYSYTLPDPNYTVKTLSVLVAIILEAITILPCLISITNSKKAIDTTTTLAN